MTPAPQTSAPPAGAHDGEPDLITIVCLSFNTRDYIARCFDSLLAQRTDYRVQIVVHDDASTDGSQDVIRDYADRFPGIFTPVLQPSNRWSQGFCPLQACAPHIRGAFVAICEVDDYWTETDKLQRQVDYLRSSHRNFIGTQCQSVTASEKIAPCFPKATNSGPVSIIPGECILSMRKYVHTSTFFLSRYLFQKWVETFRQKVISADLTILVIATVVDGSVAFLNYVTSNYRVHEGGFWTSSSRKQRYSFYANTWRIIFESIKEPIKPKLSNTIQDNIAFFEVFSKNKIALQLEAIKSFGFLRVARAALNMIARRLYGN